MLKYLALGDSYTIGEAVAEGERWPVQLASRLSKEGMDIAPPQLIATTGWTTDELLSALEAKQLSSDYDLVSLLIGVNNQYRGYDLDLFRQEFTALVQKAIYFARKKTEGVFVLSIPDYGVTPFAAEKDPARIARELEEYNSLAKAICERLGVRFYDITPASKLAEKDPTLLAEDQLHPSGKMYTSWVAQIYDHVVKQIKMLRKV